MVEERSKVEDLVSGDEAPSAEEVQCHRVGEEGGGATGLKKKLMGEDKEQ